MGFDVMYRKDEFKSLIKAKIKVKFQYLWDNEQTGRRSFIVFKEKWVRARASIEASKKKTVFQE